MEGLFLHPDTKWRSALGSLFRSFLAALSLQTWFKLEYGFRYLAYSFVSEVCNEVLCVKAWLPLSLLCSLGVPPIFFGCSLLCEL